MIHGQVAVAMAKSLDIDEIFVLNDAAAADDMQVMLLELAAPVGSAVRVCSASDGVEKINDGDFEGDRTMVIFKTIDDVANAVRLGYAPQKVCIGGMYSEPGKQEKAIALYVDESDIKNFRFIADSGVQLIYQVSPLKKELPLEKVVEY